MNAMRSVRRGEKKSKRGPLKVKSQKRGFRERTKGRGASGETRKWYPRGVSARVPRRRIREEWNPFGSRPCFLDESARKPVPRDVKGVISGYFSRCLAAQKKNLISKSVRGDDGDRFHPLRKGMRARELGLKRERRGGGARARSRLIKNERMTLCPEVRSRCLKGRSEMSFSRNKGSRSRHRGQSNVRLLGRRRDLAILIQYSKR